MAAKGIGIDEGTATVKVVEVEKRGPTFIPVRAASIPTGAEGTWESSALSAALNSAGIKGKNPVAGLTGKDVVIRYHQVPSVPDWQLRNIMTFEIDELQKQSGDEMAADFNLLPVSSDLSSDDLVLLALTREARVNERTAQLKQVGLKVRHFSPNAIALYHAFRIYGPAADGDVIVASIGHSCSDLCILRDGDLLYARSVNTAGDVLTSALVEEFNVSEGKAEKLKREFGDLRPREQRQGLTPQQEKVSYALEGAAGRLFSMVQSTAQFAKSQIQLNRLEPAKVFVTGGTANIPGLADYLGRSLDCPVEVFDPLPDFDVEPEGPASSKDYVVALGLAVMAADPEAYSVEVLAAPMRKAREFQEKHLYTVLAAVLALLMVGFDYMQSSQAFAQATQDSRAITSEQRKRQNNVNRKDQLLEERQELIEKVGILERKKAAGEGLARSLAMLVQNMPEDLWVREVELDYVDEGRARRAGRARPPVVVVEGSGKSRGSRSVDDAYAEFIQAMRAEPALSRSGQFVDQPPTQRDKFDFRLTLKFLQGAAPAEAVGEEEEE